MHFNITPDHPITGFLCSRKKRKQQNMWTCIQLLLGSLHSLYWQRDQSYSGQHHLTYFSCRRCRRNFVESGKPAALHTGRRRKMLCDFEEIQEHLRKSYCGNVWNFAGKSISDSLRHLWNPKMDRNAPEKKYIPLHLDDGFHSEKFGFLMRGGGYILAWLPKWQ